MFVMVPNLSVVYKPMAIDIIYK